MWEFLIVVKYLGTGMRSTLSLASFPEQPGMRLTLSLASFPEQPGMRLTLSLASFLEQPPSVGHT